MFRLNLVSLYSNAWKQSSRPYADAAINEKIERIVKGNKVVVFMKGAPDSPRCGFSSAVIQIMRKHGVPYDSYDVLFDETIRQGVKDFSNWPTIPQVYIDGEFIGGCDIVLQMHQSGELVEALKKVGIESALLKTGETRENAKIDENQPAKE